MAPLRSSISRNSGAWLARVEQFAVATLRKTARTFERDMIRRTSGPTGPESLSVRTGALRRSLRTQVLADGKSVRIMASIGAGAPYTRIHEHGGIVTPKNAKNLAIPVGAAKTAAGVARGGPRAFGGGLKFVVNRKTGKKLLIDRAAAARGQFKVMFVLVRSVTIPARLGFRKTFARNIQAIRAELRAGIVRIAGTAGGRR